MIANCGTVATVVGDPKQSRPISPDRVDYSAIDWILKRSRWDTLRISNRLPDRLSALVDEFARYNGLRSSPEIASRRLALDQSPDLEYRDIIQPDETTTWVDINGSEQPIGPTSWANDMEAKACAKICHHLTHIGARKSIVVVSRFNGQKQFIRSYLQRMGHTDIKVTTTTGALGTQADIVLFSLTRNNPERNVGAAGTLQDINVAISRPKEKLIIMGNFAFPETTRHVPSRMQQLHRPLLQVNWELSWHRLHSYLSMVVLLSILLPNENVGHCRILQEQ